MSLIAQKRVLELLAGTVIARAIYSITELEIPDKLDSGPQSVKQLADTTGYSEENLKRLMRALHSIGVFELLADGRYALTPVSECLRKGTRDSLWSVSSFFGKEMYQALSHMPATVRTGNSKWEAELGQDAWRYLAEHQDRGEVFDEMLDALRGVSSRVVASVYPFPNTGVIVDVGGGNGSFLCAILSRHSELTGVLFDLPTVVSRVEADRNGFPKDLKRRISLEAGDFFERVPGGDIYVLRHVLHDWDDVAATRILQKCRESASAGTKIILVEEAVDIESASHVLWQDLGLMCSFGGRERTTDEYCNLLSAAGFSSARAFSTVGTMSLIEACG